MKAGINLIWIGPGKNLPKWNLGETHVTSDNPRQVYETLQLSRQSDPLAWLFWDEALGEPEKERIQKALQGRGNLWHAGLRFGMAGRPGLMNFVKQTWMLIRDPDPNQEASSWRLSLRACLIQGEVLRQMGFINPDFETLDAASLELGHRYVSRGVITRHVPWLVSEEKSLPEQVIPFMDEVRVVFNRFGRNWTRWALLRSALTHSNALGEVLPAWRKLPQLRRISSSNSFERDSKTPMNESEERNVTILIPTLERYPYLKTLLQQLRQQTVKPLEIIVVDQTPKQERDLTIENEFKDLPMRYFYLNEAGQCSSRNFGLRLAKGKYILFLDDDDEVPETLIESHLKNLREFQADVSSGIANEVGAGTLPENFTFMRVSDVFPTNNTLIHRCVLDQSGLFDLAYEKGQRADGDLGMRVYLSGALMMLNPEITVLHHHAPRGGLRAHKARVITYASSRQRLNHRHLPSITEIYLAKRYFNAQQVRELLWVRVLGTFSIQGGPFKKLGKALISLLYLPNTIREIRKRRLAADHMLLTFPQIPRLDSHLDQLSR